MWPALSFVLHTLFFSFTKLQDIYYSPSFPREEMHVRKLSLLPQDGELDGVQAELTLRHSPAALLE